MKIWIAKDWYETMVFLTRPRLIENDGRMEFTGYREPAFEQLIPDSIQSTIVNGEMKECEVTITECV